MAATSQGKQILELKLKKLKNCTKLSFVFFQISHDHLTALLKIIADTCKNYANKLDSQLVTDVANLAVNELTGYAENQSYDILVGLSREHCSLAMEALLTR